MPFSEVLSRSAVMVHHGGIGTTSQALAAGAMQVVCPKAHDQFDNAARLEGLGVGACVKPGHMGVSAMTRAIERSMICVQAAGGIADRMKREGMAGSGILPACEAIEAMGKIGG